MKNQSNVFCWIKFSTPHKTWKFFLRKVSSHNRETAAKLICSWEIKQQITCEGPILPLPRLLINKEGTRKGVMVVSGISAICFWQKTLCESHFYFTQVNKYSYQNKAIFGQLCLQGQQSDLIKTPQLPFQKLGLVLELKPLFTETCDFFRQLDLLKNTHL